MKSLVLAAALVMGLTTIASAALPEVYPSGPANLLPTDSDANKMLWFGGNVAKAVFEGMTAAPSQGDASSEIRVGKGVSCYRDTANKVEYSCILTIESATGEVVSK